MTNKVPLPIFPQSGGCQCGAVRYQLNGAPIVFYICHCTSCQRQSSSAFGQSLRVNRKDLEINGALKAVEKQAASGGIMKYEFCPQCGTRLFHSRSAYNDTLNIKAGSLDDTSWLVPAGHIWVRSKQSWFDIPTDAITYEKQPQNYDVLEKRWREITGNKS